MACSIAAGVIVMPSSIISAVRPDVAELEDPDPDDTDDAAVVDPLPALSMSMACIPSCRWPGTLQYTV